jgi:cyclopropane-fatty-acyl-phospholipid synthase
MKRDRAQPLSIPAIDGTDTSINERQVKTLGFEKWLLRKLLERAGNPPVAIELWNGQEVLPATGKPTKARLIIKDRQALLKICINPDLHVGELYMEGRLVVDADLEEFIETISAALPNYNQRGAWDKLLSRLYLVKRNTMARAKDNIYHHYDLGNEFYKLWLDERMLYTCAYFPNEDATLEQAQLAKMDHVARKLRLQPGQEVVEAGCGWGALALHMAKHYGVRVKAYNISKEQLAYARERARAEGMDARVEYIEGDYREIRGEFDAFVSVGMLEHVGRHQYEDLGDVINRCLRRHGRGLIHTIGRNRPMPVNAWIERRIFPGGYVPSLSEMTAIFEPHRFSILEVENFRLHLMQTLRHWLLRFDANSDKSAGMWDEPGIRAGGG